MFVKKITTKETYIKLGFTIKSLRKKGIPLTALLTSGYTVKEILEDRSYLPFYFRKKGIMVSIQDFKKHGYSLKEILSIDAVKTLKHKEHLITDILDAGFTIQELLDVCAESFKKDLEADSRFKSPKTRNKIICWCTYLILMASTRNNQDLKKMGYIDFFLKVGITEEELTKQELIIM
ncbi:MAG: hypothetical protein WJU30_00162 [Candidatus Phytoplasma pruni]